MKWLLLCLLLVAAGVSADDNEMINDYNNTYNNQQQGFQFQKPLTTEEQKTDKEFVHQEFNDKMRQEACEKLKAEMTEAEKKRGADPCNANMVDEVGFVVDPTIDRMIPMLAKAYSGLFGLSGAGGGITYNHYAEVKNPDGSVKKTAVEGKDGQTTQQNTYKTEDGKETTNKDEAKNDKEEKQDVCAMIPMVTEMGAGAYQAANQNTIMTQTQQAQAQSAADAQTENMYAIARMHDTRKQSANIQGVGWGATSACYAVVMMGGAAVDFKLVAKGATSVLFTVFYGLKAKNHEDWSTKMTDRANKLKTLLNAKNCDPVREKNCYCSMPSTKYDPQYCLKKPKNAKSPKIADNICVGGNAQVDPDCECRNTGSCFDQVLAGQMGQMNLGNTYMQGVIKDVSKITNSGLDYSTLDNGSFGNLAVGKNALKLKEKEINQLLTPLNDTQKADARFMMERGLPAAAAALLARMPETEQSKQLANQLRSGFTSNKALVAYAPTNRGSEQSSLHFNQNRPKSGRGYNDSENYVKNGSGSNKTMNDTQVLNFAQKAQREAEIRKSPETPIFDIISYRYRSSAWKSLDVMSKTGN